MNRMKNIILASLMLFSFISEKLIAAWSGQNNKGHGVENGRDDDQYPISEQEAEEEAVPESPENGY